MSIEKRIELEKTIIQKLIEDALALNYKVSVFDSEEWCLKRSSSFVDIMEAVMSSDEDLLRFRSAQGAYMGAVQLVYGNSGYDVISDYTESLDALIAGAEALANKLETEVYVRN